MAKYILFALLAAVFVNICQAGRLWAGNDYSTGPIYVDDYSPQAKDYTMLFDDSNDKSGRGRYSNDYSGRVPWGDEESRRGSRILRGGASRPSRAKRGVGSTDEMLRDSVLAERPVRDYSMSRK